MNVKESVQQQFGSVAAHYATSAVHAGGPDLQAMLDAVPLWAPSASSTPAVGPATPRWPSRHGSPRSSRVDLTAEMLEQGRRLAAERGIANVIFQRGDVEQLDAPGRLVRPRDLALQRASLPAPARGAARDRARPEARRRLPARRRRGAGRRDRRHVPERRRVAARPLARARPHHRRSGAQMLRASGFVPEVLGTWPLRLQFDTWVARMHTPPAAVGQIKALFDGAPRDVRAALAVEDDYSFSVPVALIRARRDGHDAA